MSIQKNLHIKTIDYIAIDGIKLALHSWIPKNVEAILFYIHGMQSHSGWLFEIGDQLAAKAIAVFSLDRRGSGLSEGIRGDASSSNALLDEYHYALKKVRGLYPEIPLTLLGQSLGGSILAGLLTYPDINFLYDNVIFCSSPLGKQSHLLNEEQKKNTRDSQGLELHPIKMIDEDFSEDTRYLAFMKKDSLCCRKITSRAKSVFLDIEQRYLKNLDLTQGKPVFFVHSLSDPLLDVHYTINLFMRLTNNKGITLQLPSTKHYLWFTEQKINLMSWLSNFILTKGYLI